MVSFELCIELRYTRVRLTIIPQNDPSVTMLPDSKISFLSLDCNGLGAEGAIQEKEGIKFAA